MHKFLILGCGFAVCVLNFTFTCCAQEQITITTYYPSPYGSYNELRAKRIAVGENYYQSGTYDWGDEINNNADLVVEGRVGIGTADPQAQLEIDKGGNIMLSNTVDTGDLIFSNNTGERARIFADPTGGETLNFSTGTNADAQVIIDSQGKVGIGRVPAATLDINGTIRGATYGFGGIYTENLDGSCRHENPFTGGCSCPADFSPSQIDDFNNPLCVDDFYADGWRTSNCGIIQYQCTR